MKLLILSASARTLSVTEALQLPAEQN